MKSNELRLGNWVHLKDSLNDKDVTIASISNTGEELIGGYWDNGLYDYTDDRCFQPIPLIEEWLVKFGEKYNDNWYQIGKIFVDKRDGICAFENHRGVQHNLNVKLEYVHSLQNLYFALTGEELTIKELA